jgi:2'-5' RNA ligase
MRLFLAYCLPDDVSESIVRATASARALAPGVRWVPARRLHLTLKFLGDRPTHDLPALGEATHRALASASAVPVTARGIGAFPNFSRPRVVWLGMHPTPPLTMLAARLDAALAPLGYPTETRPFRSHVTLGRVASPLQPTQREALVEALGEVDASWALTVRDVVLLQSSIDARGLRYEPLHTIPLGG